MIDTTSYTAETAAAGTDSEAGNGTEGAEGWRRAGRGWGRGGIGMLRLHGRGKNRY